MPIQPDSWARKLVQRISLVATANDRNDTVISVGTSLLSTLPYTHLTLSTTAHVALLQPPLVLISSADSPELDAEKAGATDQPGSKLK